MNEINEDLNKVYCEVNRIMHNHYTEQAKKTFYRNGFDLTLYEYNPNLHLNPYNKEEGTKVGKNFICINTDIHFNPSDCGINYYDSEHLAENNYIGAACFNYDGTDRVWKFTIYSEDSSTHCDEIAKQFGGDGDAYTAKFSIKTLDELKGFIEPRVLINMCDPQLKPKEDVERV